MHSGEVLDKCCGRLGATRIAKALLLLVSVTGASAAVADEGQWGTDGCVLPAPTPFGGFTRVHDFVPDPDAPESGVVLLLHEIKGINDKTCQFAEILRGKGFRVYLPELFEAAGAFRSRMRLVQDPKWDLAGVGVDSPITEDLSRLATSIAEKHEVQIGVIGLCLTGIFPLTMLEPDGPVAAAVVSQPSLPLAVFSRRKKRDLGISATSLESSRASGVPILGFRFDEDRISPSSRWQHLRQVFGAGTPDAQLLDFSISREEWKPYRSKWGFLPGHGAHSVLTGTLPDSLDGAGDHPSVRRVAITVEYLRARLAGHDFDCESASLPCRSSDPRD